MTLTLTYDSLDKGLYLDDLTPELLAAQWQLGRDHPDAIMPASGKARFTLDNTLGQYTPETGPDLIGKRLRVTLEGTTMWQGWITSLEADVDLRTRVIIHAEAGLDRLRHTPAQLPVQQKQTADTIINQVLAQMIASPTLLTGWTLGVDSYLGTTTVLYQPADQFNGEAGQTVFPYVGDTWHEDTAIYEIIEQVVSAEQGFFWQDREGRFQFRSRHYWHLHTTLLTTLDVDTDAAAASYAFGVDRLSGVSITLYPRRLSNSGAVIWQGAISLPPNQTVTQTVRVIDNTGHALGVVDVIQPRAYTDYTAVDNNGTNHTDAVNIVVNPAGYTLKLSLANPTASPLTVSLQLHGTTVARPGPVTINAESVAHRLADGPAWRHLSLPALSDYGEAVSLAAWLLNRYQQADGHITDLLLKEDSVRFVALDIGTRLRITTSQTAHDRNYFVVGQQFDWTSAEGLRGRFILWPADRGIFWMLGTSLLGSGSRLGY